MDPTSLPPRLVLNGHVVEYENLTEVCQGGPEIGELIIDGQRPQPRSRYGGPPLSDGDYLYVPQFVRSLFASGFVLQRISLSSKETLNIGKRRPLIFLDSIKDGAARYYIDVEKTTSEVVVLPPR